MKLAFYKGKGLIGDRIIRRFTRSSYSHCELVFTPEDLDIDQELWFTSSARDGGVRFYDMDPTPENWDYLEIKLRVDARAVFDWCQKQAQENRGYAFRDILRFALPGIKTRKSRWFCSEICLAALQPVGFFSYVKSQDVSPQDLYNLVDSFNLMIDKYHLEQTT